MILSAEAREKLSEQAAWYHLALYDTPSALAYLTGRGLSQDLIAHFQLGVVDERYLEHADLVGRISIPYVTKLGGVVGFKFRRPNDDDDGSKYLSNHMSTRLYNTLAFERAEQLGFIAIAEGEFDAMILTAECGIPAVGVPGVDTWKSHPEWPLLFDGFTRVLVFRDQDEAGEKLARRIDADLESAVIINLPAKDVNKTFLEYGSELIRSAAGFD